MICVGLIVNPISGIGGRVALKGSDGVDIQQRAARKGGRPRGEARARRALQAAAEALDQVRWLTWGGAMGASVLEGLAISCQVLGQPHQPSTAQDTRRAAHALVEAGADLVLFCGGDGTARDLQEAIALRVPVLGIPAGVKMHSGVFATTPEIAGEILQRLVVGGLVRSTRADVRDVDEQALRDGRVSTRFFGELLVPEFGGFVQHTKEGGRENESLALAEIVADAVERIQDGPGSASYVLGPGGSLATIKQALGMQATLLGMDVFRNGAQIGVDVDAAWLESRLQEPFGLILSFTRRQGFLLGRGNQQLSPAFLRGLNKTRFWVVATRSKLLSLDGRPLLIDTDDVELDRKYSGLVEVTCGYQDRMWYRVETHA
ncbi:MAG: ATP-NAD kinase family protein [Gammaproteobacteria bacterium]|nr:ATP-NAD kinase family protein [Gammaproteobacteria bacterium]